MAKSKSWRIELAHVIRSTTVAKAGSTSSSTPPLIVPDKPLNVSDEIWQKTLDVNLTGTMKVCRAALPLLRQRGGAIVNIAPVAAFNASPASTSYAASKAAVVSYTRSLAYAHGADRIRGNAVAPGMGKDSDER